MINAQSVSRGVGGDERGIVLIHCKMLSCPCQQLASIEGKQQASQHKRKKRGRRKGKRRKERFEVEKDLKGMNFIDTIVCMTF